MPSLIKLTTDRITDEGATADGGQEVVLEFESHNRRTAETNKNWVLFMFESCISR